MKPKAIVTIVLLAFVAVSVGYLIVKEVRAARTPDIAAGPSEAALGATAERVSGTEEGATLDAPAPPTVGEEPSEAGNTPAAGGRKIVVTYYYNTSRR